MNKLEYIIILIITLFINSCGIARWKEFETPPYKKDVLQDYDMVTQDSILSIHFSEVIFTGTGEYNLDVSIKSIKDERIIIDSADFNVTYMLPNKKQVVSKGASYIKIYSIYGDYNIKSLDYNTFKTIPYYYKSINKKEQKQTYDFEYYEDISKKTKEINVALLLFYRVDSSERTFTDTIKLKPRGYSAFWVGRDD